MTKPKRLVVDDDESIEDRKMAIAALQEHEPALVSLDLSLPPAAEVADEGLKTFESVTGNGDRASHLQIPEADSEEHQQPAESATRFKDILGTTRAMREIFDIATRVAKTDATMLVQGVGGTCKELLSIPGAYRGDPRRSATKRAEESHMLIEATR